jgi:hypothetical protein
MKRLAKIIVVLFSFILTACANTGSSSGYSTNYYTGSWWYNDYYYYWADNYPWCCDSDGEWDEVLNSWWNNLDEDKQQQVKDNVANWQGNGEKPDLTTLKSDFKTHWNSLPEEKRNKVLDSREKHLNDPSAVKDRLEGVDQEKVTQKVNDSDKLSPNLNGDHRSQFQSRMGSAPVMMRGRFGGGFRH